LKKSQLQKKVHDAAFSAREIVDHCLRDSTSKNLMLHAHQAQRA